MHALLLLISVGCSFLQPGSCHGQSEHRERIAAESARSAESRIIGGERAAIEEYPFAVSLQNNGTFFGHEVEHFCGGGIIGEKWIITSAQCALRARARSFHVRAGTACYYKNGDIYGVQSATAHPAFNDINYDYDVGLVELSEAIRFDDKKRPIKLPKTHLTIQDGTSVHVLGWGASRLLGPVSDDLLCHAMEKINNNDCQQANEGDVLTNRMFCAVSENASLCVGDSGSPLAYNGVLFGVASWSRSCQFEYPTAYTAISELKDWISAVTGIA